MPELRKDPIIGRWVIIATERSKRPDELSSKANGSPDGECPFCETKEAKTPGEIFAIRKNNQPNTPGWQVRAIPSVAPFLRIEGDSDRRGHGLYDVMNSIGAHEVIVETPQHIDNIADLATEQIASVFYAYRERMMDLEKDQRFKYVLVFKNHGWSAGGGKEKHSRSQLIATPITPMRVKEELIGSRQYYDYHERCIFCDIIRQETQQKERVVCDMDGFVAVAPFASRFPFEVWILPKKHSSDFTKCDDQHRVDLARILKQVLLKLKKALNDPPYNYIIHTAPFRREKRGYWKTVNQDYHWHIEIMPRITRVAGFEWGSGFYICPIPPEDAARFLRETEI
ncbi:MAG TPA: galactose-1-phosphate uridylyltransferase [Candidatus Omnitrophica bacterium]|nr:galactose-1-phosphate uridylyltransferase [Candidatus Omnitrophota bacterium]